MPTVTKQLAAARQIDAAIDYLFADDPLCAITLAGAAEGSMPLPKCEGQEAFDLFTQMKKKGVAVTGLKERELVSGHFNLVRDWLKHDRPEAQIEVAPEEAVTMVLRAMTKFIAVYGDEATTDRMRDFEGWLRATYPTWLETSG